MKGFSIRLAHKIMALGVVGLVGLLVFGAIYLVGSWSRDRSRAIADQTRAISDLNTSISIEMLEARRAEKDFELRRDQSYSKHHAELSAAIDRDFGRLETLVRSAGFDEVVERIDFAHRGFSSYVKEFDALAAAEIQLGLNETLGLTGSLRTAVHDIEAKLAESDNPRLTSAMLMMRRHEKDFMLRRDAKYIGELKATAATFSKLLASADIAPAVKADIDQKLQQYQVDFSAWAKGAQETAQRGEKMSQEFHDIEPAIASIQHAVERRYDEATAAEAATRDAVSLWMLVAFGLAVVVVGGTSFSIGRSLSSRLIAMVRTMTRLAGRDFSVAIPSLDSADEVGEMARAMEVFKVNMGEAERLRADRVAAEDRQLQERVAAVQEMATAVERETGLAVGEVSAGTDRMAINAAAMSESAVALAQNSSSVAAAAEEALANSRTLIAAASQLNHSITEISSQVSSSRKLTVEAVAVSSQAQATIAKLSEAASKVGTVTNLISEIASQTNLLALNATIEAARAGEAGRGFAVVASEVKSLAEQTAKATSEIAQQIAEIQQATQESVASISAIGEVIGQVETNASTTAAAIEKQNAVTIEISRTVEESAAASREVAAQIANVSNEAAETGRRAADIRDGSADIAGKVEGLRTTLVRVVRTSTADADRRRAIRTPIDRPGTIEIRGARHKVDFRDISVGGAMVGEDVPGAAVDVPVTLTMDGISTTFGGTVARVSNGALSIKFNLSDAARNAVQDLIAGRRAA
jgi:methyl-accepting chemotaxis protein